MILTEESRAFPLKQPGLSGGSEMLHSAARGRMEKLVQTCLPDLEQRGRERERGREGETVIINDRFLELCLKYQEKKAVVTKRSEKAPYADEYR